MNTIQFSHEYPKLWGQTECNLIHVRYLPRDQITPELTEYDTRWHDEGQSGYYQLPETDVIQLIFIGNKGIPFCTLRRFTKQKLDYYTEKKYQIFQIEKVK